MSDLEHRQRALSENPFAERHAAALASIEAQARSREASSYAWMAAAMSYGEAAEGPGRFGKIASGAKWFVIWTAMIVPNLLFMRILF